MQQETSLRRPSSLQALSGGLVTQASQAREVAKATIMKINGQLGRFLHLVWRKRTICVF
jgi:hypothetical protein